MRDHTLAGPIAALLIVGSGLLWLALEAASTVRLAPTKSYCPALMEKWQTNIPTHIRKLCMETRK